MLAAAAHGAAPVNEYEQQRLDRIKANMERMKVRCGSRTARKPQSPRRLLAFPPTGTTRARR
jgi:hypothetical protein